MTEDTLKTLLTSGFQIYPNASGRFVVKKAAVPASPFAVGESEAASYEEAVELAVRLLAQPRVVDWTGIVRYNRGLGVEYRTLVVAAATAREAEGLVREQAERVLAGADINEVRVRPKK